MDPEEKCARSLAIQNAYAAREIDRETARRLLFAIDGSPDLAGEILGIIEGQSDVIYTDDAAKIEVDGQSATFAGEWTSESKALLAKLDALPCSSYLPAAIIAQAAIESLGGKLIHAPENSKDETDREGNPVIHSTDGC